MIVLGFDTATTATAAGLMLADGSVLEGRDDPSAGERPGHSTRMLPLAHELLAQAGIRWSDVQRLAVGVGPGTFTGLRIGIASATGLAQSLGVELVGVSSLHALARGMRGRHDRVLAAIDARRGEVFAAAYRQGEELASPRPLPPERLGEVLGLDGAAGRLAQTLAPADAVAGRLGQTLAPADATERPDEWWAAGDGARRYAAELQILGVNVPVADSPLHLVSARAVCELGAQALAGEEAVLPSYCRAPDAEAALQGVAG